MISYLQAVVIGPLQGVTELFPISSLGHSVLVPALIGGSWQPLVTQSATQSSDSSPYLAFIVALHVATAAALVIFFRADWVRVIRGFLRTIRPSIAARHLVTRHPDERLAWLLIVATIPVGITGLALEHVVAGFGEQALPAFPVGLRDGDPFAEHPSGWGERLADAVRDELGDPLSRQLDQQRVGAPVQGREEPALEAYAGQAHHG